MTRRPCPSGSLYAAEEAYAARFGEGAPTWYFGGHPRLAAVLRAAVADGEKLTVLTLAERPGVAPPVSATARPGDEISFE